MEMEMAAYCSGGLYHLSLAMFGSAPTESEASSARVLISNQQSKNQNCNRLTAFLLCP
jgi:hypothetical protein